MCIAQNTIFLKILGVSSTLTLKGTEALVGLQ